MGACHPDRQPGNGGYCYQNDIGEAPLPLLPKQRGVQMSTTNLTGCGCVRQMIQLQRMGAVGNMH